MGKEVCLFAKTSRLALGPLCLLFNGEQGVFFWGGRGVQQLGHDAACSSHLVPRLQVDEGIPSLPCISAWCAKRQFYLYLHFIIRCGEMCQFITNMLQKWMWYSKCFTTLLMVFDVPKSVHHHKTQIIQPTRCNSFTSLLLDVYVWLNMFRASPRPSSGAEHTTALGASGFTVGEKRLKRCWLWSGRL